MLTLPSCSSFDSTPISSPFWISCCSQPSSGLPILFALLHKRARQLAWPIAAPTHLPLFGPLGCDPFVPLGPLFFRTALLDRDHTLPQMQNANVLGARRLVSAYISLREMWVIVTFWSAPPGA